MVSAPFAIAWCIRARSRWQPYCEETPMEPAHRCAGSDDRTRKMITSSRRVLGILGLLLALVQTAPADNAAVWQALNRMPAAERRAVLEREARREGTLVLYGATGLDRAQFWIGEFNKRYPDIKVEFVRLQATELYQKVAAERRTGQLRADLVITTITYLDLLKEAGAFAPYETSHWADFDPRFRMGSFANGW